MLKPIQVSILQIHGQTGVSEMTDSMITQKLCKDKTFDHSKMDKLLLLELQGLCNLIL